jgi:hypothetical protein
METDSAYEPGQRRGQPEKHDSPDNSRKDNPTFKSIATERDIVCKALYISYGELTKQEVKFDDEKKLYHQKKCLLVSTEDNYQRYRNLDITVGAELLQTNESIKANVDSYNVWNTELIDALKQISNNIKDAKVKFGELKKAAHDLESSYNDSCSTSQRLAITGKAKDCKDTVVIPEACVVAGDIIEELISKPKKLGSDIDSIFKSAFDVMGIQMFSNIESLEPLQKDLNDYSQTFQKQINTVATQRLEDLKKQKEELVWSVKEITKAAMGRNTARSTFEGYYDSTDFLCNSKCECQNIKTDPNCDPAKSEIGKWEMAICNICGEVKETFCCDGHKKD